jgi:hypothetical protein
LYKWGGGAEVTSAVSGITGITYPGFPCTQKRNTQEPTLPRNIKANILQILGKPKELTHSSIHHPQPSHSFVVTFEPGWPWMLEKMIQMEAGCWKGRCMVGKADHLPGLATPITPHAILAPALPTG